MWDKTQKEVGMRPKNGPDRVHVVKQPDRNEEVLRMLAQISDRLRRSEVMREELMEEVQEYRAAIANLEDRAEKSEKAYLHIEGKLNRQEKVDTADIEDRLKAFEKRIANDFSSDIAKDLEKDIKETKEKVVKAVAGLALVDERVNATEMQQVSLTERVEETVAHQTRLDRRFEKSMQDKSRVLRKVERLEELVAETQDSLKAKALVLLTDKTLASQYAVAYQPADQDIVAGDSHDDENAFSGQKAWWQKPVKMNTAMASTAVIAALVIGWGVSTVSFDNFSISLTPDQAQNRTAQFAQNSQESDAFSRLTSGVEETTSNTLIGQRQEPVIQSDRTTNNLQNTETQIGQADTQADVLGMTDSEKLAAFEEDADSLAVEMNAIEPSARTETAETTSSSLQNNAGQVNEQVKQAEKENYQAIQDEIQNDLAFKQNKGNLSDRISPDPNLPEIIKEIEVQAFAGNAEAQHDLAAIYTAGHGGVKQDFGKAVSWFEEAAINGIANAQYNLGVLYHQGLGAEQDINRAIYWYNEASKLKHPEAQYNLGIASIEGIGMDYDPEAAADYFETAAKAGIVEAAYNLGLIHENNLITSAKQEEALYWYKKASDQGSPEAAQSLEQLASSLQIGLSDVANLVERMDALSGAQNSNFGDEESSLTSDTASDKKAAASNTTSNTTAKDPELSYQQQVIAKIQTELQKIGLYPGPSDGILGPQTTDAIRTYRSQNDLPWESVSNTDLLAHLLSITQPDYPGSVVENSAAESSLQEQGSADSLNLND